MKIGMKREEGIFVSGYGWERKENRSKMAFPTMDRIYNRHIFLLIASTLLSIPLSIPLCERVLWPWKVEKISGNAYGRLCETHSGRRQGANNVVAGDPASICDPWIKDNSSMSREKKRNKEGVLGCYVEKLGIESRARREGEEAKEEVEEISGKEIRERVSRNINFEKLFFSSSVRISPCMYNNQKNIYSKKLRGRNWERDTKGSEIELFVERSRLQTSRIGFCFFFYIISPQIILSN